MAGSTDPIRVRRRAVVGIVIALIALLVFGAYHHVTPYIIMEYNSGPISPQLFTDREAELLDEQDEGHREKGLHVLMLRTKLYPYIPVLLRVQDTTAPSAEAVPAPIVPLGNALTPDQLVTALSDNDIVRLYYEQEPDFVTIGPHSVDVIVEDLSQNRISVPCAYCVRGVIDELVAEAGTELPEAAGYLICDPAETGAELLSDYSDDMMHHVGRYDVVYGFRFKGNRQEDVAHLTVVDSVAPTGQGTSLVTGPGQEILPESFVTDAHDETDITFTYVTAPDLGLHEVQEVVVRMIDEGGNSTDVRSTLTASTIQPMTMEARRGQLTAADFGLEGDVQVEAFEPSTLGMYLVKVWIDGQEEASLVTITDTTPPSVRMRDVGTIYTNHPLQPEELFETEDVFDVSIGYIMEPDWTKAGEQQVAVRAVDANGNVTEKTETILLTGDRLPPVLYGVRNRNVYLGESVAYLAEVYAVDDVDGAVQIEVDTKVDIHREGTYEVTYSASDLNGNQTSASCRFTVIQPTVTDEMLRDLTARIMSEITTPDMVKAEKLKAIFWYVRNTIRYGNGTNHNYTDWRRAAYEGLQNGRGDCYNIWAATKALVDQTDIEYVSVERVKTERRKTRHYWINVNLGTGWYVFDPTWTRYHKFECFMWTEKQCDSCVLYWHFDTRNYPPLATEPFDYDAVVAAEKAGLLP